MVVVVIEVVLVVVVGVVEVVVCVVCVVEVGTDVVVVAAVDDVAAVEPLQLANATTNVNDSIAAINRVFLFTVSKSFSSKKYRIVCK